MGKLYTRYIEAKNCNSYVYACRCCHTHLAANEDIISKHFQGSTGSALLCRLHLHLIGKAYLFQTVLNVLESEPSNRQMTTGLHTGTYTPHLCKCFNDRATVTDIFCHRCTAIVGWKYVKAWEHSQKYKEDKFVSVTSES